MVRQTKSKKPTPIGRGNVTPVQIAFIVDRYLCDNNFSETRSVFRNEASSLISKASVREAPKSLLSLGAILDEYIRLKEQKVVLDQERFQIEQDKFRVQNLLQGMQDVMNVYNSGATTLQPTYTGSLPGCPTITYKSPTVVPISILSNRTVGHGKVSSTTNCSSKRKRIDSNVGGAPPTLKRSSSKLPYRKITSKDAHEKSDNAATAEVNAQPSSLLGFPSSDPLLQGSSVAKSLFNQVLPPNQTSPSGPNTPQRKVSSPNGKSASPTGVSSNAHGSNNNTPHEITPTNCTVVTSERVTVSPCKRMAYYTMERNHCISTSPIKTTVERLSKRDSIKGRLDFDNSDATMSLAKPVGEISTSGSDKDDDLFNIDLPNLEAFGANFSELLGDLDLGCEVMDCPCQPTLGASSGDTTSGSSHESKDGNTGGDHLISEFSSTTSQMLSEKDMHMQGCADNLTTMKSVTKCIRVLSPVKNHRSSLDQETSVAGN